VTAVATSNISTDAEAQANQQAERATAEVATAAETTTAKPPNPSSRLKR
jgi:ribonuclease E